MIIQKANTDINTEFLSCLRNANDMSLFEHVCLVKKYYAFSNVDAIKTIDEWNDAIRDGDIFPLYNVRNVDILSETTSYLQSQLNVQYQGHPGKYIFRVKFHYNYYYYQKIQKISGQDYDIIFIDISKNAYAYSPEGTFIKGIPTELINFEKIKIGDQPAKYTEMYIVLDDPMLFVQNGIVEKLDFKFKDTVSYNVTLSDADYTDDTLSFKVFSVEYNEQIFGLNSGAFTIVDDINGPITFTVFSTLDNGTYVLDSLSNTLTKGYININENAYYGIYRYIFSGPPEPGITYMTNAGGVGTTDWINPTDGVAQFWRFVQAPHKTNPDIASIVTGNGFTGNAQRLERTVSQSNDMFIYTHVDHNVGNKEFIFKMNYRHNSSGNWIVEVQYYSDLSIEASTALPINTGDAVGYEYAFSNTPESHINYFRIINTNALIGDYIEIDELILEY